MFPDHVAAHLQHTLDGIRDAGTWKAERVIVTPQNAAIRVDSGQEVLNFCANNYLGLSDHPALIEAAKRTLDERGFGMSSVRFICGTQDIHKELERKVSAFVGTDDAILYSSCFDANGGLFETLCGPEDAIISDSLNHASIIDGVRLSKAQRFRYANNDMADLRAQLEAAAGARIKLIATDGVFSMDGYIANLAAICDLADEFGALVMVDDSHAVGFIGATGRGTPEYCGVMGRVDIITGTLGKALGGASGGYTAARRPIVDLLRQRSRPYLFSNTVAPAVVGAAIAALAMLSASTELRDRLEANTKRFRAGMQAAGFALLDGDHAIVPIMLGDARLASTMADAVLEDGIYVIGFSFPVVPKGQARIRVQLSAAHTHEHIDRAVAAFTRVGRELGVV
jgi:glycine C-acetyltransferase